MPLVTGGWGGRMPPKAPPGVEPQVLVFELDTLAERYRTSLWGSEMVSTTRHGLVAGWGRLRERFLLVALTRTHPDDANELLAQLRSRGVIFDAAFTLPYERSYREGRGLASAYMSADALSRLRRELEMTRASMCRRVLLISSLQLEHDEVESRLRLCQLGLCDADAEADAAAPPALPRAPSAASRASSASSRASSASSAGSCGPPTGGPPMGWQQSPSSSSSSSLASSSLSSLSSPLSSSLSASLASSTASSTSKSSSSCSFATSSASGSVVATAAASASAILRARAPMDGYVQRCDRRSTL